MYTEIIGAVLYSGTYDGLPAIVVGYYNGRDLWYFKDGKWTLVARHIDGDGAWRRVE